MSVNPSTTKRAKGVSQCPYAVALSEDEASQHSMNLADELRHCPAFALPNPDSTNSSGAGAAAAAPKCPFQGAKTSEQVQKTLASIPKSHYTEHQRSFYHVMQHLHKVNEHHSTSDNNALVEEFVNKLGGQCPMQPYVASATSTANVVKKNKHNFARAMENCSMAAIMARLAADFDEDDNDEDDVDNCMNDPVTPTPESEAAVKELKNQVTTATDSAAAETDIPASRNSLAEALKTGTAVSHQAAEDVHFVKNFIQGKIDRHLYQEMILGLYHVYVALEEALDQHAPTVFPTCHFPEQLRRKATLEEDMEFWHNTKTPSARTISPAVQEYIDRIHYLAAHDPLMLLAHSYTRYLGDLSGGKILARVARRAMDLDKNSGEGLAFYRFDNVPNQKAFKDQYRQALDALPLTEEQVQALVAEANVAFCFNMRLFQELDVMATIPGARIMSLEEVMEYAHKDPNRAAYTGIRGNTNKSAAAGEDQCPFLINKKKEQQAVDASNAGHEQGKRCPWPFVFAHDPVQGIKDWQTWLVVALVVAWLRM